MSLLLVQTTKADQIWDGGGADAFWNTAANWGSDTLPAFTNAITFAGTVQASTSNNLAADSVIGGINLTNTISGQGFTLSGNRIRLGGNIVTSTLTGGVPAASITDVINMDLVLTGTRTITAAASSTNGNHHVTINGIISETGGSFGITKNGNSGGVLTLAALNTFAGTVTLTSGTISFNTIADSGGESALGAGGTIITGNSSGSTGTLLYTGSGSSTNRQIQIGTGSATDTTGVIIQSDGSGALTFTNTAFNALFATSTVTKTLTLQGSSTAGNTISGVIANNNTAGNGFVALSKAGTGTWVLAGANTFSGGVSISAGTLNLNNAGSGGTSSALGTGTLTITGGMIDNTSAGAITLSTANAVAFNGDFAFGGTQDLSLGGGAATIGGFSRTITLNGSKTLTMGQIQWNSDANRTLTVTQGTGSGGKLVLGGFQLNINTATAARTRTVGGTANVEISGAIVNGNSFANNLTYSGTAMLTLSAANSYTGTTSITGGGVLDVGSLSAGMLTSGGLVMTNGSVLQGSGTFTRTFSGASTAAAGEISAVDSGFAARGGTLTLNFGGAGASLALTSGGFRFGGMVFGSSTADNAVIVVNPISTNGTFVRTFTVKSGVGGDYAELQGAVTSTGSIVKEGTGLLILSGTSTVTGSLTINAGTVQFGSTATNSGTTGAVPFSSITNNGSLVFSRSNALTYGNVISGTGNLSQTGAGTTTLTAANTYSGATIINAGALQLGNGGTAGTLSASSAIITNGTLIFNHSNALVQGTDFAFGITGTGGITHAGSGTATLSGTNSYAGTTSITGGGILDVGSISGGTLGSGGLVMTNGSILQGNGAFTRTFSGASTAAAGEISAVGSGFAARGGTLTLNFGGAGASVALTSGGFRFGDFMFGSAAADSAVIVVNPLSTNGNFIRTFTVNSGAGGDYVELQGAITNIGSIVKAGTGLLILSGTNTVTGSLTINAGTVQFGSPNTNSGTTGAAPFSSIINNGSIIFNRSNALSYANSISGGGSVTQAGAGTATLSGASTYSGGTTINSGSLIVTNTSGSATGTGVVTAVSGTTIGGSGTISPTGTNGIAIAGGVTPGVSGVNNGVGTLTFIPVDGNVTFQSSSSVAFELRSNSSNDKIVFSASGSGVMDFSAMAAGSLGVTFVGGYTPALNDSFDLLDWAAVSGSGISGLSTSLLNLSTTGFDPSWTWDTSQFTISGIISVITIVPEPSRALLLACGLAFAFGRRRR